MINILNKISGFFNKLNVFNLLFLLLGVMNLFEAFITYDSTQKLLSLIIIFLAIRVKSNEFTIHLHGENMTFSLKDDE